MKRRFSNKCLLLALSLILSASVSLPKVQMTQRKTADAETVSGQTEVWDTWSDTWALTDALGRTAADASVAGNVQGDKQVGIFYSVWHDSLMEIAENVDDGAPRNITQIIEENPDTWKTDASLYGPGSSMHYWGEPLYGYYDLAEDDWVVRAHATLLAEAGVDYLIYDMTNFYASGAYNASESNLATIENIFEVFRQMRNEGQQTPTITMLFTWNPINCGQAINWMYENVIQDNLDLWYNYEGKPLVFGSGEYVDASFKDVFAYKSVAANYDAQNSYQWLSNYPQSYVKNTDGSAAVMTVSVAQNWTDALASFTHVNEYGQFIARGRSWTSESSRLLTNPTDPEYNSEYGYNFQEQFNRALDIDPDMLIVTGWNEWIAARFYDTYFPSAEGEGLPNYANFVDGFTTEFSRDIEMSKEGELKDNFYNQLVENIRLYKGVRNAPDYKQEQTIPMTNDFSAWEDVASYYRDSLNDNVMRDADGVAKYHYTNFTGRNDFTELKVCRDDENVYFYAKCTDKITGAEDGSWMRLYIKTTGENGWEGFNYVINRESPVLNQSKIYKFNGSWESVEEMGKAKVVTKDNEIAVSVKLADLGLSAENVSFEFKWHDNSQADGDAMEFYLNGDCAPNARFNYVYEENAATVTAQKSVSLNEEDTEYAAMATQATDTVAHRFTAKTDFVGVDVASYNLDNLPAEYTVSLYRFKNNYETTVAQEPLTTATYTNSYDETYLYTGAKAIGPGEYLVVVSGIKTAAENTAGLYYCENQENGGLYLNGQYAGTMGLKARIYYANAKAITATSAEGTEAEKKTLTLTVEEKTAVSGLTLKPVMEKGVAKNFPTEMQVFVSADGVNYTPVSRLTYTDYMATNTDQTFALNANVKSVKIVYDGELAGAELIAPCNLDGSVGELSNDDDVSDSQSGGCTSTAGVGGVIAVVAMAAFVQAKKRRN